MDGPRHQLLSVPDSPDKRRRVRAGGLRDQFVNRHHRRAASDQPRARKIVQEHGRLGLALFCPGDFASGGDIASKEIDEVADLERLGDEIARALGQGMNGQVYRTLRRD